MTTSRAVMRRATIVGVEKTLSVRIPDDLHAALLARAEELDRPASWIVRRALEETLRVDTPQAADTARGHVASPRAPRTPRPKGKR